MSDVVDNIRRLLGPILRSLGLSLWDLEFKKEGPQWLLRIYIDRESSGVTLDDCEAVSRDLGTILDVEEVISHAYRLEVSSPGLDRRLSRPEQYLQSIGKLVKIKTYESFDGEKVFQGTIRSAESGSVVIEMDKGILKSIPFVSIASAQYVVVI
jgi:ribosome maturation factor RimP